MMRIWFLNGDQLGAVAIERPGAGGDEPRDLGFPDGPVLPHVGADVDLTAVLAPSLVDVAVQEPRAFVAGPVLPVAVGGQAVADVGEVAHLDVRDRPVRRGDGHPRLALHDVDEARPVVLVEPAILVLAVPVPAAVVVACHEGLPPVQPSGER